MKTLENSSTAFKRNSRLFFLGILFCLVLSCKSEKNERASESNIEEVIDSGNHQREVAYKILAQEKAWAAALVANDLNIVEALMHRDFRLKRVYGDALPISKEMYLSMTGMSASKMDVTHFEILDVHDDLAIAKAAMSMDWQQEGVGKLPPYAVLIDTWQKSEDGTWQILSRVSQILEEPYTNHQMTD
ncbi:nuclear transport factor 2 family protein [Algoriphagus halophilus]|nr:nuclear transport factor 2 family protein [Algoriphagus halophilus]